MFTNKTIFHKHSLLLPVIYLDANTKFKLTTRLSPRTYGYKPDSSRTIKSYIIETRINHHSSITSISDKNYCS